ncbi:helix-turn-helix transcriptional regulator [Candidatus Woesearchaeota archaeon]|nr:helix-turn-helix transcriptional regulator [Candidatus Woesearchaeota archaeon]
MIFLSPVKPAFQHTLQTYQLFFGSLANPNRLQIINTLRQGKKSGKNVTEICAATGFEQTMVSHNLKRLERCGMLFAEQRGKRRYYTLNKTTIRPLLELIDHHMDNYCSKLVGRHSHHDHHSRQ